MAKDVQDLDWLDFVHHGYYRLLEGHEVIVIPTTAKNFAFYADIIDRLVITGGNEGDELRSAVEYQMILQMAKRKKFTLGICHGSFLLTHLLKAETCNVDYSKHDNLVKHNLLYNDKVHEVISYHRVGIEKMHATGQSLAVDEDGYTEAWIDYKRYMCGVLYHVERMNSHWLPDEIYEVMFNPYNGV